MKNNPMTSQKKKSVLKRLKIKKMEMEKISGRQVIMEYGRKIISEFSLEDPKLFSAYRQTYEIITKNLKSDLLKMQDQKGLLMIGARGSGKTICMKIFHRMLKDTARRFKWVKSTTIKDMVIDKVPITEIKEMFGAGLHADLYIDDLGIGEVDQNQFGNMINIMSELIHDRDELYVNERILTHFSTNLLLESETTDSTITRFYGQRSSDRIKQMTKTIAFHSKSLRT